MGTRIRAVLAAAAVAGLAIIAGAGTAGAASTPLVQANNGGWSAMSYRPGHIYVGMGGAPFVRHLSWGSWAGPAATTRSGQIVQQWPCGKPIYQCPASVHPVNVYLHDVQTHGGNPYFAKMRWSWVNSKGKARVAYWLFGTLSGGTVPGWNPRS